MTKPSEPNPVISGGLSPNSDAARASAAYWMRRSLTLPSSPELPLVSTAIASDSAVFKRRQSEINANAWRRLKQRAGSLQIPALAIPLAAYAEVLAIWSKHSHFTIKVDFLHSAGEASAISLLEIDNSKGKNFEARARHHYEQLQQSLEHAAAGEIQALREVPGAQDAGAGLIAPVVFTTLRDLGVAKEGAPPAGGEEQGALVINRLPTYLNCMVHESRGNLVITWDAVDEMFHVGVIEDMFQAYQSLLQQLANEASRWHRTLADNTRKLLPEDQARMQAQANDTAGAVSEEYLHTLFLKQVVARPGQIAVSTPSRKMCYGEVYSRACRVEEELLPRGLEPNQLVGIVMVKGWEQVVGVLGVLFAGGAYMPIDPELPPERQRYLIENGDVKVVLTQSSVRDRVSVPEGVDILVVDQMEPLEARPMVSRSRQKREDLAYVIYTSGSTGQPKGVMIDHCGAVNTVLDVNQRFGVGPEDSVLAVSRLNFDLSVYDIFGLLAAGGTVVMPAPGLAHDTSHWAELLVKENVTLWNTVPSLMGQVVEKARQGHDLGHSLRVVMLSGDWIPVNLPGQIRQFLPNAKIVSMGGATEASIWSILYPIENVDPSWKSVPYGKPMRNQTFSVLNESQAPCPVWVPGQLYIGGIGLARGYWRDARKTHRSFIHHASGHRLYRTGDWGRYLPDGNIEFLGREDAQVKLYGYRIELGEIEAKLQEHAFVDNCVVVVREDATGGKHLVGYVVTKSGTQVEASALRDFLRAKLPDYMVPAAIVFVDQFPLTANGKVDRKALPAAGPAGLTEGALAGP